MLGRILGRGPVAWCRWGAHLHPWDLHAVPPLLCCARGVGNRARVAQGAVLQTAAPGWSSHQGAAWCPLQMRFLHQIPRPAFKNERRPTNFDKKVLVWAGRFKKEEDIPKYITSEVLDAARNTVRIKVCYIMIALTLLGCLAMVITGKEAAKKDHTLLRVNEEKKAKWRAEAEKDHEAAAVKAQ
ncbi:protein FAM162B-like [Tympanuchus pallidicinctus]|uniref:protein FAM162B-like n=1 Tax=Tympanuchus pallidicinctus TaxID=109042 RepID=UPI0022874430|nr:protein FAM162B-like [Tympanuchus pallidicinctus]